MSPRIPAVRAERPPSVITQSNTPVGFFFTAAAEPSMDQGQILAGPMVARTAFPDLRAAVLGAQHASRDERTAKLVVPTGDGRFVLHHARGEYMRGGAWGMHLPVHATVLPDDYNLDAGRAAALVDGDMIALADPCQQRYKIAPLRERTFVASTRRP